MSVVELTSPRFTSRLLLVEVSWGTLYSAKGENLLCMAVLSAAELVSNIPQIVSRSTLTKLKYKKRSDEKAASAQRV